jgi:hypothetical protein
VARLHQEATDVDRHRVALLVRHLHRHFGADDGLALDGQLREQLGGVAA